METPKLTEETLRPAGPKFYGGGELVLSDKEAEQKQALRREFPKGAEVIDGKGRRGTVINNLRDGTILVKTPEGVIAYPPSHNLRLL